MFIQIPFIDFYLTDAIHLLKEFGVKYMYDFRWPQSGDKPFVNSKAWRSPTYVNLLWLKNSRFYDDSLLANAFKESADKTIDELAENRSSMKPDYYFLPILYLYRHAIELDLKEITKLGIELQLVVDNDKIRENLTKHNLHKLWNSAKEIISSYWFDSPQNVLNYVENIILDFHNADPSGQCCRYSEDMNGYYSLNRMPDYVELLTLKDVMDGVFNFFNASIDGLTEALKNRPNP